jgi:hypothetical protein
MVWIMWPVVHFDLTPLNRAPTSSSEHAVLLLLHVSCHAAALQALSRPEKGECLTNCHHAVLSHSTAVRVPVVQGRAALH